MSRAIAEASELSPRELRFVEEYLKDENATRAYIAAGFDTEGISASVNGSKKLKDTRIRAFLERQRSQIAEEFHLDRSTIMRETNRLATFDVRKLFDQDGKFIGIKDLDDETAAAIAGFDFEQIKVGRGDEQQVIGQTVKIKLANKGQALDMAHRILGSYKADNEQKGADQQALADFVGQIRQQNKGLPLAKRRKKS